MRTSTDLGRHKADALQGEFLGGGQLDLLKSGGFVLMLLDHINKALFAGSHPWMTELGKLAFPIFAVVFAYNLAHHFSNETRFVKRTLLFGAIAQWPFMQLAGTGLLSGYCINILFVFLIAWAVRVVWNKVPFGTIVAPLIFVAGSLAATSASYSWAGFAVILCLAAWFRSGKPIFGILSACSMISVSPASLWVAPVTILVIACVCYSNHAARMNRFLPSLALYAAYAGHLWLLVLLARLAI